MRPSSELQRQRILDAAAELFAQDGFAGARVDQIAAAAGVNKRMLYHHVGAKAELFAQVLVDQAGRVGEHSLDQRSFWSLLLEEAAHSDSTVLLNALVVDQASRSAADLQRRLAAAMFHALLPAAAQLTTAGAATTAKSEGDVLEADSSTGNQRKPRLRMMPQVTASGTDSTRSPANRSK